MPDEKESVLRMLKKKHATSKNLSFRFDDTEALQKAFDPAWESAVPYTVLLAPDGKVLYKNLGTVDILELRRTILANLPSDYIGFNQVLASGQETAGATEAESCWPAGLFELSRFRVIRETSESDERVPDSRVLVALLSACRLFARTATRSRKPRGGGRSARLSTIPA